MPTKPKLTENMDKHLTNQERQAADQAERDTLPDRGGAVKLKPAPIMTGIPGASGFWKRTLKRMAGVSILDDLDSDALSVYCVMMARYQQQSKLLNAAGKALSAATKAEDLAAIDEALNKIDAVSAKMTTLEKTILQYADKLGLTPAGRVRLARQRAQAAADAANDPDGDLFGDG